jgi:acetylxylan esterase
MSLSKKSAHMVRGSRLAWRVVAPTTLCAITFAGSPLWAASLTGPVSGWDTGGTQWVTGSGPNQDSMYVYVPDKVVTNPPILVLLHYCGGNAAGVFGEANGGGIVAASDQYGFIMVVPQTTNNCWDVSSKATQSRTGGGDSEAVYEMVKYAIPKYGANADRVYVTGTSSGAMMTELMIAVFPDMFKGGAEFSGTPAGCLNIFDGSGKCGYGTLQSGPQLGDLVRAMDPGYSGLRPRVQLWHGPKDTTIVYENQTEAVAQWTNVLGLSVTPTSTQMVLYTGHQTDSPPTPGWTRQQWQSSCGYTVLDEWSEDNGPHGTSANLNAMYVIPFLALDQAGAVDPEVAQCSGDAGSGGSTSSSGSTGSTSGSSTSSGGGSSGTGSSSSGTTGGSSGSGSTPSSSSSSSSGGGSSSGADESPDSGGTTSGSQAPLTPDHPGCSLAGTSGAGGVFACAGLFALDLVRRGRRRQRRSGRRAIK